MYSDPDTFNPLRFYKTTADCQVPPDASLSDGIWTFGYVFHYNFWRTILTSWSHSIGRRSCPGRRLAVDSVWLVIAYLLWSFNITGDGTERDGLTADEPFAFLTWRDAVNM